MEKPQLLLKSEPPWTIILREHKEPEAAPPSQGGTWFQGSQRKISPGLSPCLICSLIVFGSVFMGAGS